MPFSVAMLALEASDGTVVLTSISLVFGMLVALCLIITLEGKLFDSLNAKNKKPAAPAPAPKPAAAPKAAAPAPAPKPAADGSIPSEVVAAISAAVYTLFGSGASVTDIQPAAKGHRRAAPAASANRRGAWGQAGVNEHTTPFM